MKKLLMIGGLTATGKTKLGIYLAKKFNGEIISADSRQVYQQMDILTGKDIPKSSELEIKNKELGIDNDKFSVGYREKEGVPIWLVDIIPPDYPFNVTEYSLLARKVVLYLWSKNKLPIVVGGTGFYLKAYLDSLPTFRIPPNKKLRKELEGKERKFLQEKLIELDLSKWEKMNPSDRSNPRRLIRAIEIALFKKEKEIPLTATNIADADSILFIGLRTKTIDLLYPFIEKRVRERIKEGVLDEVRGLFQRGYPLSLSSMSACGVRNLKDYLEGRITLEEAIQAWILEERHYARMQLVWFRKEKRIRWFDIQEDNYEEKIEREVKEWYTKSP